MGTGADNPADIDRKVAPLGSYKVVKTVAYDGGAGSGAIGTVPIFTVTGDVIVKIVAVCADDLIEAVGTGTTKLGTAGDTEGIIESTTSSGIDAREVWYDKSPSSEIVPFDSMRNYIITDGNDIIQTIETQPITDGDMIYYCYWIPMSDDGNVVAA